MATVAEDANLIFYAEGDDAVEYLDMLEEEGEAAVIDHIIGGKLDDIDREDTLEPEDGDDDVFEHDDGFVLIYNPRLERLWLYQLPDVDDGV